MMSNLLPRWQRLLFLLMLIGALLGAAVGVQAFVPVDPAGADVGPQGAGRFVLASADTAASGAVGAQPGEEPAWRSGPQHVGALEIELVADVQQVVPGEPFRLGLHLRHEPHWHTYWRNPGDTGFPTRFEVEGPTGAVYSDIVWPAPERFAIGPLANYGYEGENLLFRQVTLPADYKSRQARFRVRAEWLICREVCVPGEAAMELRLPVGGVTVMDGDRQALFDASSRQAPLADRTPLQARWWQRGAEALLVLPAELTGREAPASASFLPYFADVIRPVAPQRLVELSSETGRYALALELDEQAARSADEGWEKQGGILLIDDQRPVEVVLQKQTVVPVAGRTVSVDRPIEVELEAQAAATNAPAKTNGGLLGQLQLGGKAASPAQAPADVAQTGQGLPAGEGGSPAMGGIQLDSQPGGQTGGDLGTLLWTMAAALLGGLILNLMPCVFPVIGLKILSFTEAAAGRPAEARRHAMVFCLGVVASFVALALVLVGLRSLGQAAGWGFQLQSPVFVAAMALLFVGIGLNLFGVFEAGSSFTRFSSVPMIGTVRSSYGGSFMTGVMAVVVATPCTAPFMGSAVGFTLGSSSLEVILVFTALGLGMGVPYLVLASSNQLLAKLPRPGPWLQTFRQFLAFPMFATAAWLVWVLAIQTDAQGVLMLLLSAILLSFSAWIYGRWQFELRPREARSTPVWLLLAAISLAGCIALVYRLPVVSESPGGPASPMARGGAAAACLPTPEGKLPEGCQGWQPWSPDRVMAARAAGQPVFIDFTAAWCLSCQLNKRVALDREEMLREFRERNILLLRADWTRRDPQISAELAKFGRNSVPFYLFYNGKDPNAAPEQLPELLTVDIVRQAIGAR
ncbi:MAG: thioredoxin family protein [Lautropia sp.]|nr:thioredoxin family protein [Lautropia sp.]